MQITNNTRHSFSFATGGTDQNGHPKVDDLGPNETRAIDIPADHPALIAGVSAGALTASGAKVEKAVQDAARKSESGTGVTSVDKKAG